MSEDITMATPKFTEDTYDMTPHTTGQEVNQHKYNPLATSEYNEENCDHDVDMEEPSDNDVNLKVLKCYGEVASSEQEDEDSDCETDTHRHQDYQPKWKEYRFMDHLEKIPTDIDTVQLVAGLPVTNEEIENEVLSFVEALIQCLPGSRENYAGYDKESLLLQIFPDSVHHALSFLTAVQPGVLVSMPDPLDHDVKILLAYYIQLINGVLCSLESVPEVQKEEFEFDSKLLDKTIDLPSVKFRLHFERNPAVMKTCTEVGTTEIRRCLQTFMCCVKMLENSENFNVLSSLTAEEISTCEYLSVYHPKFFQMYPLSAEHKQLLAYQCGVVDKIVARLLPLMKLPSLSPDQELMRQLLPTSDLLLSQVYLTNLVFVDYIDVLLNVLPQEKVDEVLSPASAESYKYIQEALNNRLTPCVPLQESDKTPLVYHISRLIEEYTDNETTRDTFTTIKARLQAFKDHNDVMYRMQQLMLSAPKVSLFDLKCVISDCHKPFNVMSLYSQLEIARPAYKHLVLQTCSRTERESWDFMTENLSEIKAIHDESSNGVRDSHTGVHLSLKNPIHKELQQFLRVHYNKTRKLLKKMERTKLNHDALMKFNLQEPSYITVYPDIYVNPFLIGLPLNCNNMTDMVKNCIKQPQSNESFKGNTVTFRNVQGNTVSMRTTEVYCAAMQEIVVSVPVDVARCVLEAVGERERCIWEYYREDLTAACTYAKMFLGDRPNPWGTQLFAVTHQVVAELLDMMGVEIAPFLEFTYRRDYTLPPTVLYQNPATPTQKRSREVADGISNQEVDTSNLVVGTENFSPIKISLIKTGTEGVENAKLQDVDNYLERVNQKNLNRNRRNAMHSRCFNCEGKGHLAQDCPKPWRKKGIDQKIDNTMSKAVCHNCNEKGHYMRDCIQCFNCGEKGHKVIDCPRPTYHDLKTNDKSNSVCHNCNEIGHYSRDCIHLHCFRCGGKGHSVRDCIKLQKVNGLPHVCSNCKEKGHFARDCIRCFNCGEKGHKVRDCNIPRKSRLT